MRARDVSKVFGATHALRGVDFTVAARQGHGAVRRERRRQVDADEDPRRHRAADHRRARARRRAGRRCASPREAADRGIVIIHQELSLFPNLSIADNLFMAREQRAPRVVVDQRAQREPRRDAAASGSRSRSTRARSVGDLRLGQQQIVEIARALAQDARVLIMDEPTSALSTAEVEVLFRVIRELTADGVAIVYISHHLEEALEIADHVVVVRDGQLVGEAEADEVDLGVDRRAHGRPQPGLAVPGRARRRSARSCCASEACTVRRPRQPGRLAVDESRFDGPRRRDRRPLRADGRGPHRAARDARGTAAAARRGDASSSTARRSRGGRRRADRARRSRWCPRTASATGSCRRCRSGRTCRSPACAASSAAAGVQRSRSARRSSAMIARRHGQGVRPGRADHVAERRQPAEGRARQGAAHRAARAAARRAHARHRRRRQGRHLRADRPRWPSAGLAVLFATSEIEEALHVPDRLLVMAKGKDRREVRREATRAERRSWWRPKELERAGVSA